MCRRNSWLLGKPMLFLLTLVAVSGVVCTFPNVALSKDDRAPNVIRVIRDGQTKKVDGLLKKNPDVNVQDDYGWTPLLYAVFRSDIGTIEKLLSHGADLNLQDRDGVTPLIAAILQAPFPFMIPYLPATERRATDVALFLIEKGADLNRADSDGNTPLIYAVNREQGSITEALIKKGADCNRPDSHGRTPLYFVNNPDKAREWAPAQGALSSSLRMRGIKSDESRFPAKVAAEVAMARQQASIPREENKKRIAALLREAGATAPDSIRAAGNYLLDRRPQRLGMGPADPIGQIMVGYMRMTGEDVRYRLLVCVAADGKVNKALVMTGLPDGVSEKLQKAALKLKYQPAMKDGQAVESWDQIIGGGYTRVVFQR